MFFDRFDIVSAHYAFCADYHGGLRLRALSPALQNRRLFQARRSAARIRQPDLRKRAADCQRPSSCCHLAQLPPPNPINCPAIAPGFLLSIVGIVSNRRALARKAKNEAPGKAAWRWRSRFRFCQEQLVNFKPRLRSGGYWPSDGADRETADRRIQAAREQIKRDANMADRQEDSRHHDGAVLKNRH